MTTALRCLLRNRGQYCSSWMQGRCACAFPAPKQARGALLWLQGHEPHGVREHHGCGIRLIPDPPGEGQWGMRPGSHGAAASLGHRLGVGVESSSGEKGQLPVGFHPAFPTRSFPSSLLPGWSHSTSELAWSAGSQTSERQNDLRGSQGTQVCVYLCNHSRNWPKEKTTP